MPTKYSLLTLFAVVTALCVLFAMPRFVVGVFALTSMAIVAGIVLMALLFIPLAKLLDKVTIWLKRK